MQEQLDYISRQKVGAVIKIDPTVDIKHIRERLPMKYMLLDDGTFGFPAGHCESYVINGKNYNQGMGLTLKEQLQYVISDLTNDGFTPGEIDEFIEGLKIIEEEPIILDLKGSKRWLQRHPSFRGEALSLLDQITKEIKGEAEINFAEWKKIK